MAGVRHDIDGVRHSVSSNRDEISDASDNVSSANVSMLQKVFKIPPFLWISLVTKLLGQKFWNIWVINHEST